MVVVVAAPVAVLQAPLPLPSPSGPETSGRERAEAASALGVRVVIPAIHALGEDPPKSVHGRAGTGPSRPLLRPLDQRPSSRWGAAQRARTFPVFY